MTEPRTTAELVEGIIEVDSSISLVPFIAVAHSLVEEMCEGSNAPSPAYTEDRLTQIETWLAAHFYSIRDNRLASEAAGPVSGSYQFKIDIGLNSSMYGQTALRLDTNGGLARAEKAAQTGKRKPTVFWLGRDK